MPRCDGLDPLVQNPNQAKNMPRNYFTKPTILLSLQVHMVGVHCHPNDICTIMPPRYRGGRHGRIVSVLILKKEARDRTWTMCGPQVKNNQRTCFFSSLYFNAHYHRKWDSFRWISLISIRRSWLQEYRELRLELCNSLSQRIGM